MKSKEEVCSIDAKTIVEIGKIFEKLGYSNEESCLITEVITMNTDAVLESCMKLIKATTKLK